MLNVAAILGGALAILLAAGCAPEEDRPVVTDHSAYDITGKWVVIADTSGAGDTGHLFLNSDGTFTGEYTARGFETDSFRGTYEFDPDNLTVTLSMEDDDGQSNPLFLWYDEEQQIIRDLLHVAYARPGDKRFSDR